MSKSNPGTDSQSSICSRYLTVNINSNYVFVGIRAGLTDSEYSAISGMVNMYFLDRPISTDNRVNKKKEACKNKIKRQLFK